MAGNYVYVDDATSASGSQGPGPLPDNAYDRALSPGITAAYFKSPNAVYFNSAPTLPVGFWFGSRETFVYKDANNLEHETDDHDTCKMFERQGMSFVRVVKQDIMG